MTLPPASRDEHHRALEGLAAAARALAARGLVLAAGGNVSVRIGERIAISPTGAWLERLDAHGFADVPMEGPVPDASPRPSSEWPMHRAAYRARPEARCVLHLHPPYAVLLDALGEPVRPVTFDHALYSGHVVRVPYLPPGSPELAAAVEAAIAASPCVLLAHHGCVVAAGSPDEALQRALNLEEAAEATHRALLLGRRDVAFPAGAPTDATPA